MIVVLLPLIICIIGLVMYIESTGPNNPSPRTSSIGFAMFWVGLFVTLMQLPQFAVLLRR